MMRFNTFYLIFIAVIGFGTVKAFLVNSGSGCGCGGPSISLCGGCTPRPRVAAPPFAPPPPPEPPLPPKCECPPSNCYSCPPAPSGCGCGGSGGGYATRGEYRGNKYQEDESEEYSDEKSTARDDEDEE